MSSLDLFMNTDNFSQMVPEIDLIAELNYYNKLLDYYVLTLTKRQFECIVSLSEYKND